MQEQILITIDQNKVDTFNSKYLKEHTRARKKPIKYPRHPSLNEYMGMSSVAINTLKTHWENFIFDVLLESDLVNKNIQRCRIIYTTYFKVDRRHDVDNISPKFIFDGLVKAGFIADDDYKHIIELVTRCDIDAENPRTEILVEVME